LARPLARLIYSAIASLDGYTADEKGNFDWAAPDEEMHRFVNELERPIGTHLYGRRMYETMRFWDTPAATEGQPDVMQDYARIWRAADKVVYSRTLERPSTPQTRLEREFDPEAIRRLKSESPRDLSIGGPELAAQALEAGLVDELQLLLVPVVVGGGTRALPDGLRRSLQLEDERRLGSGAVFLGYRIL
jgi:dihydrofolate reductase